MKAQPTDSFPNKNEILSWYKCQKFSKKQFKLEEFSPEGHQLEFDQNLIGKIINQEIILFDVRSPFEYEHDKIQNAYNLAVFDNYQRHVVGTLYKSHSQEAALKAALYFAEPKWPEFDKKLQETDSPVLFYCLRGGARSKASIHFIQKLYGHEILRLSGCYKSYRKFVVNYFANLQNINLLNLSGLTGTGKSKLLNLVKEKIPFLDFELYANHSGSVFGNIPFIKNNTWIKVSQSLFESKIFWAMQANHINFEMIPILCEDEGLRIGFNRIPKSLYEIKCQSPRIWLETSLEKRVENIIDDYFSGFDLEFSIRTMSEKIEKLKKYLNKKNVQMLVKLLNSGKFAEFSEWMLVNYYDKLYTLNPPRVLELCGDDLNKAAEGLKEFYKQYHGK